MEPTTGYEGPRAGVELGQYRLIRLLGAGGFGEVYEAEDTVMHRRVALKLLNSTYSHDPVFRERLFREARTAGALHEPHVVPIHGCGEIDGRLYIDMRLIGGTDLATVLKRGPLDPARAVAIVTQVAAALDAAHAAGMIHRDVKPANILLTDDDFAYLADFGLANAATDTNLTSTGTTIGTFAYLAPERLTHNAAVEAASDVYSLACVLYEMLTGTTPYPSADLPQMISAHLTAPIPRPSHHNPALPTSLDDVIATGMAKNPADRYASAKALASAVQHALGVTGNGLAAAPTRIATATPGYEVTAGYRAAAAAPTALAQSPVAQQPVAPRSPVAILAALGSFLVAFLQLPLILLSSYWVQNVLKHSYIDGESVLGGTLRWCFVVIVVQAVIAVTLVTGGICLLCRRASGRLMIAAGCCTALILAAATIVSVKSMGIWSSEFHQYVEDHTDKGSVLRWLSPILQFLPLIAVPLVVATLILVLQPSCKRGTSDAGCTEPASSGIAAAVLSVLAAVWTGIASLNTLAYDYGLLDPGGTGEILAVGSLILLAQLLATTFLVIGAVRLLRRHGGRRFIAVGCCMVLGLALLRTLASDLPSAFASFYEYGVYDKVAFLGGPGVISATAVFVLATLILVARPATGQWNQAER